MSTTHEPSAPAGGSFCVIGLAHGSRHPEVRSTIDALMAAVGTRLGVPSRAAFLDLTDPDLDSVAVELAAAGHRAAVVVPLLFTEAFHATVDVPAAVAAAAASSGLELRLAAILGTGDDVADLLLNQARLAGLAPDTGLLLYAVGSSRPAANACVDDLAGRLSARRAGPVRAGFGTVDPRAEIVLAELAQESGTLAVLPLFLAPGLLLDPIRTRAVADGSVMAPPLGDRAADLVATRYRSRLAADSRSAPDAQTVPLR